MGDYPVEARAQRHQGKTVFILAVSADGAPVTCDLAESSGWRELDTHTCALAMARMRFRPAIDTAGAPVQGLYSAWVDWRLPPVQPLPQAGRIERSFLVDSDGLVSDCRIVSVSRNLAGRLQPGLVVCDRNWVAAFTDGEGNLVRRRVTVVEVTSIEEIAP